MEHPDHPDEGYSGYMITPAASALYSTTRCQDPEDVGKYFIVPTTAITNTNQKSKEIKLQVRKNLLNTYRNMLIALQKLFEIAINYAYHSVLMTSTGMARRGFGNNKPPAIPKHLNILYDTPSLQ